MSLNQDKNLSLLHGVSLNDKDKVIWMKYFQTLQRFVKEVLNLSDGVWGSPGGDAKQYKSKEIDIRWYPDTVNNVGWEAERRAKAKVNLPSFDFRATGKNPRSL